MASSSLVVRAVFALNAAAASLRLTALRGEGRYVSDAVAYCANAVIDIPIELCGSAPIENVFAKLLGQLYNDMRQYGFSLAELLPMPRTAAPGAICAAQLRFTRPDAVITGSC